MDASAGTWSRVLIERATGAGFLVGQKALAKLEEVEIRSTRVSELGNGDGVVGGYTTGRLSLARVRIEDTREFGLRFRGAELNAEDVVIRNVAADGEGQEACIKIRQGTTADGSTAPITRTSLERVVVEGCEGEGMVFDGGEHTARFVTLAGVRKRVGYSRSGVVAAWDSERPARLELSFSVIRDVERSDVAVSASEVRLLGVYGGATDSLEGTFLTGALVAHSVDDVRSVVDLEGCHFEGGFGGGLKLFGTDADVRGTIVEGSRPGPPIENRASFGGFGVFAGPWAGEEPAGPCSLTGSIVRGSAGAGVVGYDAELILRDVSITGVEAWPDGTLGDGLWLSSGTAELSRVRIDDVVRGGIVASDGADLRWGNSRICANPALSIDGATEITTRPNVCACEEVADGGCAPHEPALSSPSLDDETY